MFAHDLAVLAEGLPALPERLAADAAVPVARWAGPTFGAVLHVEWFEFGPGSDVQLFARDGDGWEAANGSGGTGWWNPPFQRPPPLPSDAVWFLGQSLHGSGDWSCHGIFGIAGTAAALVEVQDDDTVTTRPLESPIGAFVVAADGRRPTRVVVRDAAGAILAAVDFDPREL